MLFLYRALTFCLQPLLPWFLKRRVKIGKEETSRLRERYGIATKQRPDGDLIWVHAASVGEMLAVLPLIDKINSTVLLTTMTKTSADLAKIRMPPYCIHQFIPLDTPQNAKRFIDYWQPKKAIFTEQELWPNLILQAQKRNIPLFLVNARFSEKSMWRWSLFPKTKAKIFGAFKIIFTQTKLDLPNSRLVGNLKFDTPRQNYDESEKHKFQPRNIWLAASTHQGEEEILIEANPKDRLLILAPRHPERREAIKALLPEIKMRSKDEYPSFDDRFYLVDTIGEMALFYALADTVFMGKSLIGEGGQNPIEAILAGCTILHGKNVSNFQSLYDELDKKGGALCVTTTEQISNALGLNHEKMRQIALEVITQHKGALDKTYKAIFP